MRYVPLLLWFPVCLFGQRPSHQDYCFEHPKAITCGASPYSREGKLADMKSNSRTPSGNGSGVTRGTMQSPGFTRPSGSSPTAAPALLKLGEIDWRFAMPFADLTAGINFSTIQNSSLARALVTQLAARQGLAEADVQKIFDALGDVDQVAMSVRGGRIVVMITGRMAGSTPPPPEAGMKYHIISGDAVLLGHADAVDDAIRRMSFPLGDNDNIRLATRLAAQYDFWACGNSAIAGMAGPQRALPAGITHIQLAVSLRDSFMVDIGLQMNSLAAAQRIAAAQPPAPFNSAYLDGTTAHIRLALPPAAAQSGFGRLIAGPLGKSLGQLVLSAKNMPARPPTAAPRSTRPVIVGLDNRPKEVGESPKQP